jgi:hypothetical protein
MAGVALTRALADSSGLTAGLSRALGSDRLLAHDRVWLTWRCAIASGGDVAGKMRAGLQIHILHQPAAGVRFSSSGEAGFLAGRPGSAAA